MITLMEAYNNGTLLQYIIDCCCENPAASSAKVDTDDYETNWNGHQPLSPMKTNTTEEEHEKKSGCPLRLNYDLNVKEEGGVL